MDRSPELEAAIERVRVTFDALLKARAKVNRCRRAEAIDAARVIEQEAERAYREAADVRDRLVDVERARSTQRGEDPTWPFEGQRGPVFKAPKAPKTSR